MKAPIQSERQMPSPDADSVNEITQHGQNDKRIVLYNLPSEWLDDSLLIRNYAVEID
jgi:hypothetical protein